MSEFLVDTDWIVDVLHGQAAAVQTLIDLAPRGLAVSVISYGELYEGAYDNNRDAQAALAGLQTFLQGKELLPLTPAIAEQFGILRGSLSRHLRQQIGDMDLLIAATAITRDLTLLTRNLRHFQHVPGPKLYQSS
jgi:tRNA(fMet)-specific endonuclease VapC